MSARGSELFLDVTTELLGRGLQVRFRAEGYSMHPTIRGGEVIMVGPVSAADIRRGDIVLYHAERGITAHRVVRNEGMKFIAKGDAVGSADEPVEPQQILGRVVAVERAGRSIDLTSRRTKMKNTLQISISRWIAWVRNGSVQRLSPMKGIPRAGSLFSLCALLLVLSAGRAEAAIGVYAQGSANNTSSGNVTFSFTVPASVPGDSYLIVGVSIHNPGSVSSITWNGTALTFINGATNNRRMELWQLRNPVAGGPHNIVVTTSGDNVVAGALVLGGVITGGPAAAFRAGATTIKSATGTSATASVAVTTVAGDVVVDTVASQNTTGDTANGTGQIQRWSISNGTSSAVTGDGSTTKATGTSTTMSWSLGGGSADWVIGAIAVIPATVTAVTVNSFTATPSFGGNQVRFETGRDVNNLGFNLYREENGQRVKLNSSLLAGTALMGSAGTSFTAARARTWEDNGGGTGATYWVEKIDLNGSRSWYGPAMSQSVGARSGMAVRASSSEASVAPRLSSVGMSAVSISKAVARAAAPVASTPQSIQKQYALAAGAAVKLGVKAESWYRVTQPQLVAAGLSPNVDPRTLQLYVNGVQQPIVVEGQADGKFDPQDAVDFYGLGLDTIWSDTQMYWLVTGSGAGLRITSDSLLKGVAGTTSFPSTVEWKPRTLYFAALLNGDGNNFFGPVVTDTPVSQALTVTHLNASAGAAKLQVTLQGATAGQHAVAVSLNGTSLGNVTFSDQSSGVVTFPVSVTEGANTLTLTALSPSDVSVVDDVQLTYPHSYTADGDYLRFTAQSGRSESIGGFSSSSIQVIDITDPLDVDLLPGTVSGSAGNFRISVVPQGGGTRTLLALTSAQVSSPASITANNPSSLHSAQAGYDMVIVSHANFLSSVGPLATLRQSQGHSVKVIDVEDLYDEFNFGVKSPYALKSFLSTAQAKWKTKPRFVLLMGNGTFDPRNYLGTTIPDLVPAKLVDTALLETASDDWFVDFNGDGIPQMAIGRLPVETVSAANALVNKIIAYDQSAGSWTQQALLVAGQDQDPTDNFEASTDAIKALLPGTVFVTELFQSTDPNANSNLILDINSGQALVNYEGHGSTDVWAGGLFSSTDASALSNGALTPVVLSMTCLNGYFQDVYTNPLAKALLNASGGGAVAVWTSSGLTDSSPQLNLNQAMVKSLYAATPMTVGEAAAAAKSATPDLDVRRTWILFGDPAMKLH